LSAKVSCSPGAGPRFSDHAFRCDSRAVRRIEIIDWDHELHAVTSLAHVAKSSEVFVVADGLRAAPEEKRARAASHHKISVAISRGLLAHDRELESPVERLRRSHIRHV
jgi:hypothetical protein